MIISFKDKHPRISEKAFIAENATVIGDVEIGEGSGIWFGAVVRADDNTLKIGSRTNIQDLSVVHVQKDFSTTIGDEVTIGHRAIIHGCTIGNRVLIGMGSTVMNGAVIGEDSIVGAGALVTEGTIVPPKSLLIGFPAKFKRELTDKETAIIRDSARHYAERAQDYLTSKL